jgi:thiamine-phosphate pyrophosphorylase
LLRAVDEAIDGGVNVVQLREKDLSAGALSDLVRPMRRLVHGRALLVVNGSVEGDAEGVHLSEGAPTPEGARHLIVGRSVHSVDAAERAASAGADYLVAGPIYQTNSHPGAVPAGVALVCRITEVVSIPVLGIGGIDYRRAPEVMDAGAAGIAVISAILGSPDPRAAAARLWSALESAQA